MRDTSEASQKPLYMAGQRLEKSISLPTNAMYAQDDMNHRFNYKIQPEHPAEPKTNKACQMPHCMAQQRLDKAISLPTNAMHAQPDMNHQANYKIPEHPTRPKTKEASPIPRDMEGQRWSEEPRNDMNQWLYYEIPEHPMNPKTNRSTSKAKPKTKSSRLYLLSCASVSDIKRQKRLTGYYAYAAEGKLKASMRNTFSWFKDKYRTIVHGY